MSWTHANTFKLDAPPDRVFRALTDPAELTRWFAEEAEVAAEPGGPYRFWGRHTLGTPTAAAARGTVERYDPPSELAFSWPMDGVDTTVRVAITPNGDAGGASRVALTHEVRGDLGVPRQRELVEDHWRLAFGNLASHLAGGTVLLPDYADPAPEVRLTIDIDAPPEVVFRALVEPERVARWFGAGGGSDSAVVEPRAGGRYDVGWQYRVDGREVHGGPTRVLDLVPNERLVLDWPDWRGDASVVGQRIEFHLAPNGDGTRLTFVHAGFGRTADVGDYGFGWVELLELLKREAESRSC